ncbi:MAG: HNH endonuclease [Eubacterium sp.]|nr:HNH endonuclease [Eubacterium sp.]
MVDAKGNVFSLKRKRLMTPCKSNNGYMQVHLSINGTMKSYKIHRLVAKTFIPNPLNLPQVNHIDENKENNSAWNLEWCTKTYNMNYRDGQKRRALKRDYDEISKKRSDVQSKEVTQYDHDGRIVAIWRNAYVAESHGYNRGVINQCCLGNKKSHKGYIWKYTNNIEKQIPKKPRIVYGEKTNTHNLGRLLSFHCPRCERFLLAIYETDVERGGGISQKCKGCSTCLQAIDFNEFYHRDNLDEEIVLE